MLKEILNSDKFSEISTNNIKNTISLLLEKKIYFGIVANLQDINFNPDLPKDIRENLSNFSLFSLAGYTFESSFIKDDRLFFEAGFGENNFGSLVSIPFYSILQIIVEENIIAINLVATHKKEIKKKKDSFEVFKNNPKNKKFL
ncbi:hypothetical protein [Arcobacter porcinus]|uniref:Uncharacterized protein n=1 Tax=Arcobacter porcinus TaxID=1935204 RepID=A0A5C2HEM6_9BACT|nr:hypothetical protein [Arcobacter porcinus]OCL90178.1 hypothetical protein AAX27_01583 [Aliarcobacter thereius]OCL83223.1 hypothetical protein AAW30_01300 [Arcobacter porcinus]OCL83284.1 hypothetical protein AAW29_00875 [Arcobacter porcinus]OCL88060.1 hypothetical protein AAX30_00667 [Arcobacter porcinus]QEP41366.1 hypothetical protein APORC_1805 [Arcobacter porcinus]